MIRSTYLTQLTQIARKGVEITPTNTNFSPPLSQNMMTVMSRTALALSTATLAASQGAGNGISKTTYSGSQALEGLAFMEQ
jgi:hypothetical protein